MSLSPGTRLGVYSVTAQIGQGGDPGAQVICSTGWCWSSQAVAAMTFGFPFASRTGAPFLSTTGIGGMRPLTLDPGHGSRLGTKM